MTRLAIVIIAALLLGAAALSVAHAQEPTGSISGHIVFVGPQPEFVEGPFNLAYFVYLVPTNVDQPIDILANMDLILEHLVQADAEGNFSFTGLADGEYFILSLQGNIEDGTPSLEHVSIISEDVLSTHHAVLVTVANGQAVTGIEFVVRAPEPAAPTPTPGPPAQLSPPNQLSPPAQLSPALSLGGPVTGAGPAVADGATGRIAAGLAVAAALLLAGGLALWARSGRAS